MAKQTRSVSRVRNAARKAERRKRAKKGVKQVLSLPILHADTAGIDIGATEIFVAVPADRDAEPDAALFQPCGDLPQALCEAIESAHRRVAMESTGVYWIPLWQVLADDKFEVGLFAMLAPWLLSGVYGSFSMETEGRKEEGDIARAKRLARQRIHYVDCGTSGGVWGLERGYCLMIGGETEVVQRLDPIFRTIAPGRGTAEPTPGLDPSAGTAQNGYLHCGPNRAGHFVKMVHNGIEYGMMAAVAEGLSIIKHANAGKEEQETDAETTPLTDPEAYQYDID